MKYYEIDTKRYYGGDMIATNANGSDIPYGDDYFRRMSKGEIIQDAPVFDSFFLESFDKKKFWEWILCDVYKFIGSGSQIRGWFISEDLKRLLENFNLVEPHCFYPSKLLYKGRKLNYYIYQYGGESFFTIYANFIQFDKTIFYNPATQTDFYVKSEEDFFGKREEIERLTKNALQRVPVRKTVLKSALDFFPAKAYLDAYIVSERLKQAMEAIGITGFEFSELDYEVEIDQ